jgi:multidrug resistance efflux pump
VEILVTIAYFFGVRLVFFDYKLLRFNLFWKFVVFGLYAAAALTEIILLGQYAPYSKLALVESPVLRMAPEWGGIVKEVHVRANQVVDKGEPLFSMDPTPWENRVKEHKPLYALADENYRRLRRARRSGSVSQLEVDQAFDERENQRAQLDLAQYNLDQATIVAPVRGYPVALMLRPGTFIRLKSPVVDFVSTEEAWVIAAINQKAAEWVKPGNDAEIAFDMYPGKVFPATVDSIIWATGHAQYIPGTQLPSLQNIRPTEFFAVKIKRVGDWPDHPLRFGASALCAIYTGRGPDVLRLLRELEIRSESWLNYMYNPF